MYNFIIETTADLQGQFMNWITMATVWKADFEIKTSFLDCIDRADENGEGKYENQCRNDVKQEYCRSAYVHQLFDHYTSLGIIRGQQILNFQTVDPILLP